MRIKEFIGGSLIGGTVMILGFILIRHLGLTQKLLPQQGEDLRFVASLILALYLALTIHEFEHLSAAWIVRFKFYLFISGPFGFRRNDNNRIEFFFNKNVAFAGGIVSAVPVEENEKNYLKYAGMILAGPIMSALWAVISFSVLINISNGWDYFFGYSSFLSFAILLATTIPATTGGMYSDRSRFLKLIIKGPGREIEKALLSCMAVLQKGNSFRNLDIEKIKIVKTDINPVISRLGFLYAYHYFKELGSHSDMREQQDHYNKINQNIAYFEE